MQLPEGTSASTKEVAKVLSITGGDSVQAKRSESVDVINPMGIIVDVSVKLPKSVSIVTFYFRDFV
jgi:hypothetical protein